MHLVYAAAIALAIAAVVLAAYHLLGSRKRLPPRARVSAAFIARGARSGEVALDLVTAHGRLELELSPYLAAQLARELTGADPKRTH